MNKAASQLGKLAAGVPKKFSASELAKRTARLKAAQKKRAKNQRIVRRSNADISRRADNAHPAAERTQ